MTFDNNRHDNESIFPTHNTQYVTQYVIANSERGRGRVRVGGISTANGSGMATFMLQLFM
jgi:hypothetical protein